MLDQDLLTSLTSFSEFLDNHINDDVQCAKEIIASNAFGSW